MGILSPNENTNTAYLKWMKIYLAWHGPIKDREEAFSQKTVETFIEHLKDNYSPSSVNQAAAAIKKWARGWGCKPDITNLEKVEHTIPKILTEGEIENLVDSIPDIRNQAFATLLYDCALRISELIDINVDDVDFKKNWVIIKKRKKNNLPQAIPFSEKTATILKRYLDERKKQNIKSEALFVGKGDRISVSTVEHLIKGYGKMFLHRDIYPHLFRHTRATILRESGLAIEDIKDFLGHKQLTSTFIYAKLNPIELRERLKKIGKI